jgi:hypothetical protein
VEGVEREDEEGWPRPGDVMRRLKPVSWFDVTGSHEANSSSGRSHSGSHRHRCCSRRHWVNRSDCSGWLSRADDTSSIATPSVTWRKKREREKNEDAMTPVGYQNSVKPDQGRARVAQPRRSSTYIVIDDPEIVDCSQPRQLPSRSRRS